MSVKHALVAFTSEKQREYVVNVRKIIDFNPRHEKDFDDSKVFKVKWPIIEEDGRKREAPFSAKILCLGANLEGLRHTANEMKLRNLPPELIQSQTQRTAQVPAKDRKEYVSRSIRKRLRDEQSAERQRKSLQSKVHQSPTASSSGKPLRSARDSGPDSINNAENLGKSPVATNDEGFCYDSAVSRSPSHSPNQRVSRRDCWSSPKGTEKKSQKCSSSSTVKSGHGISPYTANNPDNFLPDVTVSEGPGKATQHARPNHSSEYFGLGSACGQSHHTARRDSTDSDETKRRGSNGSFSKSGNVSTASFSGEKRYPSFDSRARTCNADTKRTPDQKDRHKNDTSRSLSSHSTSSERRSSQPRESTSKEIRSQSQKYDSPTYAGSSPSSTHSSRTTPKQHRDSSHSDNSAKKAKRSQSTPRNDSGDGHSSCNNIRMYVSDSKTAEDFGKSYVATRNGYCGNSAVSRSPSHSPKQRVSRRDCWSSPNGTEKKSQRCSSSSPVNSGHGISPYTANNPDNFLPDVTVSQGPGKATQHARPNHSSEYFGLGSASGQSHHTARRDSTYSDETKRRGSNGSFSKSGNVSTASFSGEKRYPSFGSRARTCNADTKRTPDQKDRHKNDTSRSHSSHSTSSIPRQERRSSQPRESTSKEMRTNSSPSSTHSSRITPKQHRDKQHRHFSHSDDNSGKKEKRSQSTARSDSAWSRGLRLGLDSTQVSDNRFSLASPPQKGDRNKNRSMDYAVSKECEKKSRPQKVLSAAEVAQMIVKDLEGSVQLQRNGQGQVHLGNGVWITEQNWEERHKLHPRSTIAVRDLMVEVWGPKQLGEHSVHGVQNPFHSSRPIKHMATPGKLNAIIGYYRARLMHEGMTNTTHLDLACKNMVQRTMKDKFQESSPQASKARYERRQKAKAAKAAKRKLQFSSKGGESEDESEVDEPGYLNSGDHQADTSYRSSKGVDADQFSNCSNQEFDSTDRQVDWDEHLESSNESSPLQRGKKRSLPLVDYDDDSN